MERRQTFAEMYGTNGPLLDPDYGHAAELRVMAELAKDHAMDTLKFKLRKVKSKAMVNAMVHGHADNGNHFMTCFMNDFHFFYRGTLIYKWNLDKDEGGPVNAGEFENTASTRNQRKEIEKAIEEFRRVVLS